jgi:hypothetical protein
MGLFSSKPDELATNIIITNHIIEQELSKDFRPGYSLFMLYGKFFNGNQENNT